MLDHIGQASAVGTPGQVRDAIEGFADRTGADESMLAGATFDPEARTRSLELAMDALKG